MNKINLNALRDRAYETACEHGFHDKELSNEHCFCLVISELMEAVEADRKSRHFDKEKYKIGEYTECQGWLTKEEKFINVFNRYIKGTIEDELADAVIRLLDLYGLRGIELNEDAFDNETITDYSYSFKGKSFTEAVYMITGEIASRNHSISKSCVLPEILLLEILGLAKHMDIDLFWHIEQKMKYNKLREKMHGKKY